MAVALSAGTSVRRREEFPPSSIKVLICRTFSEKVTVANGFHISLRYHF